MTKNKNNFELIAVVTVIIINLLKFFSSVSAGDIEFLVKIMSWLAIGYVFYKISIIRILFGKKREDYIYKNSFIKNKNFDLILIISYYLFMLSDFIFFIASTKEIILFSKFTKFLNTNSHDIVLQFILFPIGGIILIMLSIIIGFKFSFEKKSFVSLINETGKPKNKLNKIYRTIISFVMLCGFFITFFSLIVEWFTLALHEPIILLGSFAIIYFISSLKSKNIKNIKKGKKILSFIDDLDENLTESFHIKKKIWLVFTGIILLNILTDFILLILPVFLGINKNVYLNTYSSINILKAIGMLFEGKFSLFLAYIYNFIALSFVSFGGTMLWYELFKGKKISIKKKYIPIYFVSLFILLIKPLFYIGNFSQKNIIGVSASFNYNLEYLNNLNLIILISSILYFIIYKIKNKISMKLIKIPFLCFVTYYLFFFLISIVNFYTKSSSLICDSTNCMYTKVFEFLSSIDIYSPITIYMVDFFQIIIKILELNFFLITLIFYAYGYFIFVKKLFETKIELI